MTNHANQRGSYSKRKACRIKTGRHDTKEQAFDHLKALVRKGAYEPMLNVYPCKIPTCGKWHVGHRIARKV
jgi:hypothetical protein